MEKLTRQHQRSKDRRAEKPEPAPIKRTSGRWLTGTKGQPFSRMKLVKITPSSRGVPAVFHVKGYTTNKRQSIKATWQNIDWFVRGISDSMKYSMLGRF